MVRSTRFREGFHAHVCWRRAWRVDAAASRLRGRVGHGRPSPHHRARARRLARRAPAVLRCSGASSSSSTPSIPTSGASSTCAATSATRIRITSSTSTGSTSRGRSRTFRATGTPTSRRYGAENARTDGPAAVADGRDLQPAGDGVSGRRPGHAGVRRRQRALSDGGPRALHRGRASAVSRRRQLRRPARPASAASTPASRPSWSLRNLSTLTLGAGDRSRRSPTSRTSRSTTLIESESLVAGILGPIARPPPGREFYDDAYFAAFFDGTRPTLERRLSDSASGVASVIVAPGPRRASRRCRPTGRARPRGSSGADPEPIRRMDVYLVPGGGARHELYCEVGRRRCRRPTTAPLDAVESRDRRASARCWPRARPSARASAGDRRAPIAAGCAAAITRKLAEAVAEQRLLWHLRTADGGRVCSIPTTMDGDARAGDRAGRVRRRLRASTGAGRSSTALLTVDHRSAVLLRARARTWCRGTSRSARSATSSRCAARGRG